MAFKSISITYQSKNLKTSLTDVKGNVYFQGSSTASFTNIAATEIGNGDYNVTLTAAQAQSLGQGQLMFVIDSASYPAQAIAYRYNDSASLTDVDAHLTAQDATLSSIQTTSTTNSTNITAIKTDLETGPNSLSALSAAIAAVQSTASGLTNNSTFSVYGYESGFVIPLNGSQTYQLAANFNNSNGTAQDPDGGTINVDFVNLAGQDFGSYMTGYTAGSGGNPGTAPMVKKATGKWYVNFAIPSTATPGQYSADVTYTMNGQLQNKTVSILVIQNVQADGFALQSTLTQVQSTVNAVQTTTNDTNTTVHANNTVLTSSSYGLQALQTNQQTILTQTNKLGDPVIGLSALQAGEASIMGSGFTAGQDDLHSIRQYLNTFVYSGGKAV